MPALHYLGLASIPTIRSYLSLVAAWKGLREGCEVWIRMVGALEILTFTLTKLLYVKVKGTYIY
jgi:hypothetical protein